MSYLQKITLMKTFPNSLSELQNRLIRRNFSVAVPVSLLLKEDHVTCEVVRIFFLFHLTLFSAQGKKIKKSNRFIV